MNKLKLETPSDRVIVMTRVFDAPRAMVWDALTKPEFLKRWFGVFGGIELVECQVATKPGEKCRYLWRGPDGMEMGMSGVCKEFVPPQRMVAAMNFDQSWYPGEEISSTTLVEKDGKTTLTMRVEYESKEARDIVLKSPMEQGVGAGFDNLENLLVGMVG